MLLAQAVEAGVAFHALVPVHSGAVDLGIDINRSHGTDIGAISTGDALIRIDIHKSYSAKIRRVASMRVNKTAAITQKPDAITNGTFQP